MKLILPILLLLSGCDRLTVWQDLVDECDCPSNEREPTPPVPSPATTPDGRAA